jgi:selenoprotein W-related protein
LIRDFAAEVDLLPSSGGVYEVTVGGEKIFSKMELKRFPRDGEVLDLIRKKLKNSGEVI